MPPPFFDIPLGSAIDELAARIADEIVGVKRSELFQNVSKRSKPRKGRTHAVMWELEQLAKETIRNKLKQLPPGKAWHKSTRDLAEQFGVSPATICRWRKKWVEQGWLKTVKRGRCLYMALA